MERKKVRAKVEVIIYDNQYLIFQASDNETILDENSLMQYDIKNIVFSDLNDKDVEWLDIVFDYIQQRDHMSVYFMGHAL